MKVTETQKHQILKEIILFEINNNLIRSDLTGNEKILFQDLENLKRYLDDKNEAPPLILLQIFLLTHGTGYPVQDFIVDWLYRGALGFHQAEGQEHFEQYLGFSVGRGANSGQGHEFKIARRQQYLNLQGLCTQIRYLCKFEGYGVEPAVETIHLIHERLVKKSKKRVRKLISYETLLREYKAWKGKAFIDENLELLRKDWELARPMWQKLFKELKDKGAALPPPRKRAFKKVKLIR